MQIPKTKKDIKILIAFEFDGIIRDAFIKHGFNAVSCDVLDTEVTGPHIQDNVLDILNEGWTMMIAHPPCAYIAYAGVRFLHMSAPPNSIALYGQDRWYAMNKSCVMFNKLKNAPIPHICIKNPVPHLYAKKLIGNYNQIIYPYYFGEFQENFIQKICLWLINLPKLIPSMVLPPPHFSIRNIYELKVPKWKTRLKTPLGIANQMAKQWGKFLINYYKLN